MEALKLELRDPLAWVRVIGFVPRELEGGLVLRRRFLGHIGQWSTGSKISKNGQRVMAKSIGFVIGPPSKHSFFRSTLQYLSLVIVLYYSPPSKTSLCGEKNKNQMIRDKASWNREIKSPSSDWPSWPQLKLDGTFVTINSKTCWQHLLTGKQQDSNSTITLSILKPVQKVEFF